MSNDAATTRSEIERIDFTHLGWLLNTHGNTMDNCVINSEGIQHNPYQQITHTCTDRRRKVRQVFTVSLVETPLEDSL